VKPKQQAEFTSADTHVFLLQPPTDATPADAVAQHQQGSGVTKTSDIRHSHEMERTSVVAL